MSRARDAAYALAASGDPRGAPSPAPAPAPARTHQVIVCRGPECGDKRGSKDVHAAFRHALAARGLEEEVCLMWQTCFGRCQIGPNVMVRRVQPGEDPFYDAIIPRADGSAVLYNGVTPADAARVVDEHVIAGRKLTALIRPR